MLRIFSCMYNSQAVPVHPRRRCLVGRVAIESMFSLTLRGGICAVPGIWNLFDASLCMVWVVPVPLGSWAPIYHLASTEGMGSVGWALIYDLAVVLTS